MWLITAGAAMFAAFPNWYATLFSARYPPLLGILFGMILRIVGIEWRGKINDPQWRRWADIGIVLIGLATADRSDAARAGAHRGVCCAHRRTQCSASTSAKPTMRIAFLSALVLELLATLGVALVAVGVGMRLVYGEMTLTAGLTALLLAPEVFWPLRRVGLGRWLDALPDGLSTVITGGAAAVSAGQRRRLLLARALVSTAPTLLLDEPTEHLDASDADQVIAGLLTPGTLFGAERTLVVATHHLPENVAVTVISPT